MSFKTAALSTPTGFTENGALTHTSSGSALLDFFSKSGAARNMPDRDLVSLFLAAMTEDSRLAMQTLAWLRDARGGAGERKAFRVILTYLANTTSLAHKHLVETLISHTPEYGRYDDLLCLLGTPLEGRAIATLLDGFQNPEKYKLAAKWMPRKGPVAAKLAGIFKMTPREWRKFLVQRSDTVEQLMCANKWSEVDYEKVPSVATARYKNAFGRHDVSAYKEWIEKVERGEAKINAGVVFPHDVLKALSYYYNYNYNTDVNKSVINAQWNALPNLLGDEFILPMVDVSGSMDTPVSGTTTAMDVAVGLGLYLAMKQTGAFSGLFLTFSGNPEFVEVSSPNVVDNYPKMVRSDWGMSTNIESAFNAVLQAAVRNHVPSSQMPRKLLIISDMEFDMCTSGTNYENARAMFEVNGYELPQVIFWNVNARQVKNSPVKIHDTGTALVSGYSPSILRGVLSDNISPTSVFLDTVDIPRYRIF